MKRVAALLVGVAVLVVGCGLPGTDEPASTSTNPSRQARVDTDKFERLSLECQLLTTVQISQAIGALIVDNEFTGPICRWQATGDVWVTFNWFEWNTLAREKAVAKSLGYTAETIRIGSVTAFTQMSPTRPGSCGVTAKAPGRGIYTWFVSRPTAVTDPCAAPKKLMEMSLELSA